MAPFALSKMPFNPNKDLALITTVVKVPEVVVVNPALPVASLAELIAYARANPGKINFGSAGAGGITHLACELLKAEARVALFHVPDKGAAPAVSDLLGGQDRKSTRLNSSHSQISYAVFCLKKKTKHTTHAHDL